MAHENNCGLFDMSGTTFDIDDIERILRGFEENGGVEGNPSTGTQIASAGETRGTHQSDEEWLDALLGNIGSQGFESEDGCGNAENFAGSSFEDFMELLQVQPSSGFELDVAARHPLSSSTSATAAPAVSHLTSDNLAALPSGTGTGAFDPEQALAVTVDAPPLIMPTYVDNVSTLSSETSRHDGSVVPIPSNAMDASVFGDPVLPSNITFNGPYQPISPYTFGSSTFLAPYDNGYSIPYLTPPMDVSPSIGGFHEEPFFNIPVPRSQVYQACYQDVPWVPPAEIQPSSFEPFPVSGYGCLPNNTFDSTRHILDVQSGYGLQNPQVTDFLNQPLFDQQVLADPPSQPHSHETVHRSGQLPRECASPRNVSISRQNALQPKLGSFVPEHDHNIHEFGAHPCASQTGKHTHISLSANETDDDPMPPSSSSQVASSSAKACRQRASAANDSDKRTACSTKVASGSANPTIESRKSKPSLGLEEPGMDASAKYPCHWSRRRSSFCARGSLDEAGRMSHITLVHRAQTAVKGQFNCFWGGCIRNHRDGGEGFKKWKDLKKHLADEHSVGDGSKVHLARMRALSKKLKM